METNPATGMSTGAADVVDAGAAHVMVDATGAADVAKVAATTSATAAAAVRTNSRAASVI